jgi:predicted nucleic acid binding AN1-type Zn finger protein
MRSSIKKKLFSSCTICVSFFSATAKKKRREQQTEKEKEREDRVSTERLRERADRETHAQTERESEKIFRSSRKCVVCVLHIHVEYINQG